MNCKRKTQHTYDLILHYEIIPSKGGKDNAKIKTVVERTLR